MSEILESGEGQAANTEKGKPSQRFYFTPAQAPAPKAERELTEEEKELERKLRRQWEGNKDLQAEFAHDFGLFLAYSKDMPGVQLKVMGSNSGITRMKI